MGQRGVWESLSEHDRQRVRAQATALLPATRDDQGRIGFDQQVRVTLGARG